MTIVRFADLYAHYYLNAPLASPSLPVTAAAAAPPRRRTPAAAAAPRRRHVALAAPAAAAAAAAAVPARRPAGVARRAAPPAPRKAVVAKHWAMHEDPEKGMERLEAQLRADSPEANVEICFSFDTTGSMAGYINEVKNKVEQLVGQLLGDLPNIRISILAHGDYCDHAKYVLRRLDLSNVAEELTDFVRGVQSTHGGDGDECYELALREVQGLSWSPASAKALVVIGDAAPHKKHEYRQIDWEEELQKLKAMGVKVYGVRCGSAREKFYETIAEETGGATLELANLQGITEMVMGLCYREAAAEHARRREAMDAASSSSSSSAGGAEEASMMEAPAAEDSEGPSSSASASASASSEEALAIHRAIHAGERSVTVRGREHAICVGFAGCRFVKIGEETYIEQNKDKSSKYARWAIDGRKITWIIRKGNWGLIMDESPKIQSTKAHTGH